MGECRARRGYYKTKQLPVKIAYGLVSSTCDQVPVRLLNHSPDKIATVEGIDDKPCQAILAVQPDARGVSRTKRQTLNKMVEKCASDLRRNVFFTCSSTYLQIRSY